MIPSGVVDSGWFDLEDRFAEWDVEWDVWQDGLGQLLLGLRADGLYAATVGGSGLSIPRQVAKTFLVGRTVFALATQFEGFTALWTAHRLRTTTQTFQRLAGFAQRKRVKPYLLADRSDGVRSTNGEQEIRFRNGSRILFGAREQGFGRGFDEVDAEVFDEAQILSLSALEDMVPATNQSRMPHGALLVFMGTPPRPRDAGDVFRARRRDALAGKPDGVVALERGDALWCEMSADPNVGRSGGPSLDDVEQVRKANPSFPHRTPQVSIDRMRKNLPDDDAWRREALGVWDDESDNTTVIPLPLWADQGVPGASVLPVEPVLSVDVRSGLLQSYSIGVAFPDGDRDVVGLAEYRLDSGGWSLPQLVVRIREWLDRYNVNRVAIDKYGEGNGALIPLLEDEYINVDTLDVTDMRSALAGFITGNVNRTIFHAEDRPEDPLSRAVRGAQTRTSGEAPVLTQAKSDVDIGPLRAVVAAWWVLNVTRGDRYDIGQSFL